MKKIFTLILAIFLVIPTFSQKLPEQVQIRYHDTLMHLQNHPDFQYPSNNFFLGWHWSSGKYMTKALGMNTIHDMVQDWTPDLNYPGYKSTGTYPDSCRLIILSSWISHQRPGWNPREARALHYNPVIQADELTDTLMDATNGFLGFKYISPTATKSGRSLYLDSITTNSGIILNDNFLADRIEYQFLKDSAKINNNCLQDTILPTELNSEELYFSINLRRTYLADNLFNSDTVLIVRIKYITTLNTQTNLRDSGYVKFNTLPNTIPTAIDTLPNNRGLIRKTINTNNDTNFVVTRAMLPPADANEKDITISGKMMFNSVPPVFTNNYYFKGHNSTNNAHGLEIDSIKIEVSYTKKFSCALNWLRIETRPAMDMYQGKWDSLLVTKIQMDINGITADSSIYTQHNITPFRWYLKDEYGLEYWATNRYFYKLIGPVFTTEKGPEYSKLYESYFGNQEHWYSMFNHDSWEAAPYIKYSYKSPRDTSQPQEPSSKYYYGLKRTYYQGYDSLKNSYWDIMAKTNENIIHPHLDSLLNCSEELYINGFIVAGQDSPVARNEQNVYNSFVIKSNNMLFLDKPWWGQYFQLAQNKIIDNYFDFNYYRPKTGEEIRSWINTFLILGAKGIFVDGETFSTTALKMSLGQKYFEDSLHITENDFLSDNSYNFLDRIDIGSDYLKDSLYVDGVYIGNYYNLDLLSQYLGVDRNHVYVGCRSTRLEVKKAHDFINSNSIVLTKLKLQEWLGKGYRKWDLIHPKFNNVSELSEFINIDYIKTRPIGRIQDDVPLYEQHTTIDSGFYDITLLAHNDDSLMNNSCYIGLLNRRLDPLIYITLQEKNSLQNIPVTIDSGYNFIATADFDDLCNGVDSTFWKEKWWQRLGAREITIPLKDPRKGLSPFSLPYAVRVTELRDSNWYSKAPYNDTINRVITFTKNSPRNLTIKLLPGCGKLLKFTYYYPESISTQPVGYPSYDLQCEVMEARYHSVYLKEDTTVNDKHSVWYRRSFPIDKTNPDAEVQWEPEQLVSKYYDFIDSDSNVVCTQGYNTLWCGPPQLVVRYDSTRSKDMVYIFWNGVCKYASDSTKGYLFESVFPAEDTTQVIPETVNKVYEYYTDLYPDGNEFEIGTVSINASKSGNYYSWSDARDGLCYAWKAPQDTAFVNTGTIPLLNYPGTSFNCFLHPDLNRYSRIDEGEDEAAIVFEGKTERTTDSASLQVFYTRLRKTRSGLQNYVSIMPLPGTPATPVTTDVMNKVIWQSANMPQTAIHKLPKIHRNIAKYEMPNALDSTYETLQLKMDRIYWTAEDQLTYNNIILTNGYDLIDSLVNNVWNPKYYIGQMPSVIVNANGDVESPTIAQGVMKDQIVNNDTLKTYYNDSSMVLSFTADGNRIFNLPHNFWTFMNPIGIDITSSPNLNEFVNTGTEPTLPAFPSVKDDSLYSFMRTFYLDDSSNTMESRENFFKTQTFSKKYHQFFGIANKDKKARWFTPIVLTNEQGQLESPKVYTHKQDGNRLLPRDTIITDWFEVKDIKSLDYIEKGNLTEDYSMKIQRQRDSKIYSLQNSSQTDNKYRIKTKMLLNGKDEKYRLLWIINKTNAKFIEQIVIGDIAQKAELDGMLEERELGKLGDVQAEEFIDLNEETYANKENKLGLSVYPNPANDELYVICYLPRTQIAELKSELNLKLYDNLGKEVYSKQIKAGQIVRIPTDNFRTGNYFVKVFQQDQTLLPAEVRNVIIER